MKVPGFGSPRTNARTGAGAIQVYGTTGSGLMPSAVRGKMLLVSAPSEFGRLRTFADETVDRPGVDELVHLLRHVGHLGVALGDMNDFDAKPVGQLCPVRSSGRHTGIDVAVLGDVQQCLLHE